MKSRKRSRKFLISMAGALVLASVVPAVVVASIITNARAIAVKVTTKLKSNTETQFTATSGPLMGLTTTCTASQSSFNLRTDAGGLGPITIMPPTFTGCTDNFVVGDTDTITSNSTNGPWTATYVNSPGAPAPNQIKLGIPKAGQTLVSSVAPSCTVTLAPTGPASVSGSYDNAGNLAFSKAVISYTATGTCPTGTGSGQASFSTVNKPGTTGAPVYSVSPAIFGIH